jgi:glycosyltransferase family protein
MISNLIDSIRNAVPLPIRKKVGPWLGYTMYFWRTRLRGRSWEPRVLTTTETLDKIKDERLSIIRFGDGELSLIDGSNLGFQKYNQQLAEKLKVVITSNHPQLLIGLPNIFGRLEHLAPVGFWFEIHHLFRYSKLWRQITSPDRTYGDAFITRPYLPYKDKSLAKETYACIKQLWAGQDIILIEGEKSRLGVGNDLFDDAHSLQRILGPSENAFDKTEEIIKKVTEFSKDHLILLSLGPAAKVIGYELFLKGYRVLDIGHIDMEYEMFLRTSNTLIPVPYKYFNEIDEREPENCTDISYQSQIIASFI